LLFTVAISITIIPEALPIMARITLARAALKLSKEGVVVKRIAAVEDLGNIDLICSDKTGTLTTNELRVLNCESNLGAANFSNYLYLRSVESNDPLDRALQSYLHKSMVHEKVVLAEFNSVPFDPIKRYSAREFPQFTLIKGAPEYIAALVDKKSLLNKEAEITKNRATKVISLALKTDKEIEYIGTVYFADAIRSQTKAVLKEADRLGVGIKIITGDSIAASVGVGKAVGLIASESEVINSSNLDFNNEANLSLQVEKFKIFTRCDPNQKFRIITALQKSHFVGYLGDGINDAPALRLANVSIVVDNATPAAKASADLILLSHSLDALVTGISEGRKAFININKYLIQMLSGNLGNFLTIGVLSLFLNYLPILPLQILISNLLTDIPSLAISSDNVSGIDLRRPMNHDNNKLIRHGLKYGLISSAFDVLFFIALRNLPSGTIQTAWFAFSTVSEVFVILSLRSKFSLFRKINPPSKSLLIAIFVSAAMCLIIASVGINKLDIMSLDPSILVIVLAFSGVYLLCNEIAKHYFIAPLNSAKYRTAKTVFQKN